MRYSFYCLHRSAIKNWLLLKKPTTLHQSVRAIRMLEKDDLPRRIILHPGTSISNSILLILIEIKGPLGRGEPSAIKITDSRDNL